MASTPQNQPAAKVAWAVARSDGSDAVSLIDLAAGVVEELLMVFPVLQASASSGKIKRVRCSFMLVYRIHNSPFTRLDFET